MQCAVVCGDSIVLCMSWTYGRDVVEVGWVVGSGGCVRELCKVVTFGNGTWRLCIRY